MTIDWSPAVPDLTTLLADRLAEGGHRPYLTYRNPSTGERTELGYATFENWVTKAADALAEEGVGAGDELLIATAGHWAGLVTVWACGLLGATARLWDPTDGGPAVPDETRPTVTVAHESRAGTLQSGAMTLVVGDAFGARPTGHTDELVFTDVVLAGADRFDGDRAALSMQWLLLADGPGWTALTQRNVLAAADALAGWGLTAEDRMLVTVPTERAAAAVCTITMLTVGGAVIVLADGGPEDWARAATEERATWMLVDSDGLERCTTSEAAFDQLTGILCTDPAAEASAAELRLRHDIEVCLGSGIVAAGCAASLTPQGLDAATSAWLAEQPGRPAGRILPPADLEERNGELVVVGPVAGDAPDAARQSRIAGHVRVGPEGDRYVVFTG